MAIRDRKEAGQVLARELLDYANRRDVQILALPRGGVPVAYEIARILHDPLDVFLVRKLGAPGHKELAMGALASGGVRVLNDDVVQALEIPDELIDSIAAEEKQELERCERCYRGDRPPVEVHGKTVILVDDGLATGSSMPAIKAIRSQRPNRIVVAAPVAAPDLRRASRFGRRGGLPIAPRTVLFRGNVVRRLYTDDGR